MRLLMLLLLVNGVSSSKWQATVPAFIQAHLDWCQQTGFPVYFEPVDYLLRGFGIVLCLWQMFILTVYLFIDLPSVARSLERESLEDARPASMETISELTRLSHRTRTMSREDTARGRSREFSVSPVRLSREVTPREPSTRTTPSDRRPRSSQTVGSSQPSETTDCQQQQRKSPEPAAAPSTAKTVKAASKTGSETARTLSKEGLWTANSKSKSKKHG